MSTTPFPLPPDDPLARAEAALRQTPVPAGPPDETVARTLAALRAAADAPPAVPFRKWPALPRALKVAAAVLLAAGGLFLAGNYIRIGPALAFADVARNLRDAHTIAYQMTVRSADIKEPVTMQVYVREPDQIRIESAGGQVTVGQASGDRLKALALDPATKTAVLLEGKQTLGPGNPKPADPVGLAEQLRKLVEKDGQPAGKKRIGDVQARGFRVQVDGQEWLIWADPGTRLPIQVEITLPPDIQVVLSEFRFNPRLDDALFRLEVPKGYKLQPMEIEPLSPEEAVVRLLRTYAGTAGGKFPKRLDDPAALGRHWREAHGGKAKETPNPETMRFIVNATQVFVFVTTLKGAHGYRPDGVKLGDADKILFWYRPAKATKYRALYGDLHWADVTTDQLPEVPKP